MAAVSAVVARIPESALPVTANNSPILPEGDDDDDEYSRTIIQKPVAVDKTPSHRSVHDAPLPGESDAPTMRAAPSRGQIPLSRDLPVGNRKPITSENAKEDDEKYEFSDRTRNGRSNRSNRSSENSSAEKAGNLGRTVETNHDDPCEYQLLCWREIWITIEHKL